MSDKVAGQMCKWKAQDPIKIIFFYVRNNVVKDIVNWSHLDSYISFEIAIVIAYMFSAL